MCAILPIGGSTMDKEKRAPAVWLHFRVMADVYDTIKKMAAEERRTISQMAFLLVEDGIAARKARRQ